MQMVLLSVSNLVKCINVECEREREKQPSSFQIYLGSVCYVFSYVIFLEFSSLFRVSSKNRRFRVNQAQHGFCCIFVLCFYDTYFGTSCASLFTNFFNSFTRNTFSMFLFSFFLHENKPRVSKTFYLISTDLDRKILKSKKKFKLFATNSIKSIL